MANDNWRTPPEVVDYITKRFGDIQIDLCSSGESNAICEFYITEEGDFLDPVWLKSSMIDFGRLAWINCPYSGPLPFMRMAAKWSEYGYAVAGILNYDTSTKWYEVVKNASSLIMPITGGRIAFLNGGGEPVKGNSKPQFMFFMPPFGNFGIEGKIEHVHISEIYGKKKTATCAAKTGE